ncbi:hydroxyisourate hydrolase [Amycolatopsis sp. SID8362]|uniref:hydroxyisourate hydrolase n=1 Tax=Amycolatopsis sp. SID8362 TaxID=2690346 RepID=UPI00136DFB53|nr:hydroxyisourate hydrolase [Amycolatopsis sp. SID8362]NBH04686.1 hydroxyisourate hydrolase [Amycolatopsis sp. SID8362]NED41386.1 hydroxyisourate hydrolase [Amycolatopsis sp. SID8362]
MSLVTTHVLDTAKGRPAPGIAVRFETAEGKPIADGRTDDDGRIRDLGPETLEPGVYRLVFDTGAYLGPDAFFPEVTLTFRILDGTSHHHVPLLLSPFAHSTYRGS